MKIFKELKLPFRLLAAYAVSTIIVACRNFAITGLLAIVGGDILNVVSTKDSSQFQERLLIFILCAAIFIVVDTLGIFWQSISLHSILNHIHCRLYEKVLRGRLDSVYQMGQRGELLSRINSDLDMAGSIFGLTLPLMYLISGIGGTIVIAGFDWRLCIAVYIYALIYLVYQTFMIKKERPNILALQENRASLLGFGMENHRNGLVVKMCNLTEALEKRVLGRLYDFEQLSKTNAGWKVMQSIGSNVTDFVQSIGVLMIGFLLYQKGQIMLGDIIIIYQMASLVITMVTTITNTYASLQNALVGFSRLQGILELPQEDKGIIEGEKSESEVMLTKYGTEVMLPRFEWEVVMTKSGSEVMMTKSETEVMMTKSETEIEITKGNTGSSFDMEASIGLAAKNLSCTLGGYTVFQNLNLQTGRKGLYILTGESGKGKTTLFRLFTGLYQYQEGSLSLFGRETKTYPLKELRSQIAYCTQENALFEGTIRDNLIWRSENVTDKQVWELLKQLSFDQWISGLKDGLDTRISSGGMEFSGGQRKSLLLVRTLIEDPAVYLLDEVFDGIDQKHTEIMLKELKRRAEHSLVVLITHDRIIVDQCADFGNSIVVI